MSTIMLTWTRLLKLSFWAKCLCFVGYSEQHKLVFDDVLRFLLNIWMFGRVRYLKTCKSNNICGNHFMAIKCTSQHFVFFCFLIIWIHHFISFVFFFCFFASLPLSCLLSLLFGLFKYISYTSSWLWSIWRLEHDLTHSICISRDYRNA